MPFKSEKQRRYLFANEPEVAKKFAKDYNMGGVASMFRKKLADGDDPFYDAWKKIYETNPDAAEMNENHDQYLEKYTLEMSTQTSEAPIEDVEQPADPMLNLFSETDALNNDQAMTTLFAREEPQGIMAARGGRIAFRGGGQDASSDDFGGSSSNSSSSSGSGGTAGPGDTGGEGGDNPSDGSDSQNGGNGGNDEPQVAPGEAPVTQEEIDTFNEGPTADGDALDMQAYLENEQIVNEIKEKEFNEANIPDNFKKEIKKQKELQYKKNIENVIKDISKQPNVILATKAKNFVIDAVMSKIPYANIVYGLAKFFNLVPDIKGQVPTDISGNIIGKNTVTGADLGFFQGDEYDDFWQGGPNEDDGGEPPLVNLITGEVNEDFATGNIDYSMMSALDKIRANQLKRKGLVQDGIIQDTETVEVASLPKTKDLLRLNSGGLAGLFKVKTQ